MLSPQLDLREACFDDRLIGDGLVGYEGTPSDEHEPLRLATRFSFPTGRRADELDPKERAEPGEGLYLEARWIVPTDCSEVLDC